VDPQFFQPAFERCGTHGVSVVGMQDRRLPAAYADSLAQAGSTDKIGCDQRVVTLGDIACNDFAAPYIDHQVGLPE